MSEAEVKQEIAELVKKYEQVKKSGSIKKYNEAETCKEFILPLFNALGWDTNAKAEVSAEEHTNAKDRADYGFYLNGWPKFYLEAKKLSADIHDEKFAKQATAYSWNKGIAWAVLADFESLIVFNSQDIAEHLSHKLVFEIKYDQYLDRFDQLSLLSKEAFTNNLLDEYGEKHGKKLQRVSVTDTLYKDLNISRLLLLKSFRAWNKEVPGDRLEEGVQKLLDRLIFIRVAEDRQLEQPTLIPMLRASGGSATKKFYQSLVAKFRELDKIYNSDLFAPHPLEGWQEYDGATEKVIEILHGKIGYYEYNFQAIPADVLGSVYENYLGYQLAQSDKGIEVSKNARKRKEQGIYYTPTYIVDYIVTNALKPVLDKCESVQDLKAIKVLDPACGSGSFLIRAVEMIYQKYLEFGANPGEMTKITILLDNIYGVDLDEQAVEIARLNLLISALDSRMPLPDLSNNIKNGNSLISGTDAELEKAFGKNYRDKKPFNWEQEFPRVFERENPGFDVIIGNPPWVSITGKHGDSDITPEELQYFLAKYNGSASAPNLYEFFTWLVISLLKEGGTFSFILPDRILVNNQLVQLREYILKNMSVLNLWLEVDFPGVIADTAVIAAMKKAPQNSIVKVATYPSIDHAQVPQTKYSNQRDYVIKFSDTGLEGMFTKILHSKRTNKLGEIVKTTSGCGAKKTAITRQKVNEKQVPILKGSSIARYRKREPYWFEFKDENLSGRTRDITKLSAKNKVLIRKTGADIIATFDDGTTYPEQSLYFLYGSDKPTMLYFLGIINSKLINSFYRNFAVTNKGSTPQLKNQDLDDFPIVYPVEDKQRNEFVELVARILGLNKELDSEIENSNKWRSIKSEIEKTDRQIDQLVYKLYNLTPEEVTIIEESGK